MSAPIRLVIVDDHPVVREGLRAVLDTRPEVEVVGEASNGSQAVSLVGSLRPDLVLMDLQMPEMDGVAAIRRIRHRYEGIEVLVVTTYDTDSDVARAVEAGATGYLLKDASPDELIRAIEVAAKGESVLSPQAAARMMERMRAPGEEALSTREIEVLLEVADGSSNREVAKTLHISEATVKTHLLHIFAKMGVEDRTAAVTTALERGIIRLKQPRHR